MLPYNFVADAMYTIWLAHGNVKKPGKAIIFLWKEEIELNYWRSNDNKSIAQRENFMPKCFSTEAQNVPQIKFDTKKTAVVIAVVTEAGEDIKYVLEV